MKTMWYIAKKDLLETLKDRNSVFLLLAVNNVSTHRPTSHDAIERWLQGVLDRRPAPERSVHPGCERG